MDNPAAKRLLQIYMDKSLATARRPLVNSALPPGPVQVNSPNCVAREKAHQNEECVRIIIKS